MSITWGVPTPPYNGPPCKTRQQAEMLCYPRLCRTTYDRTVVVDMSHSICFRMFGFFQDVWFLCNQHHGRSARAVAAFCTWLFFPCLRCSTCRVSSINTHAHVCAATPLIAAFDTCQCLYPYPHAIIYLIMLLCAHIMMSLDQLFARASASLYVCTCGVHLQS